MSVAKIIEISSSSPVSLEDAIRQGVARAHDTLKNVKAAWVQDMQVGVEDGKVTEWRVILKVTFVLED